MTGEATAPTIVPSYGPLAGVRVLDSARFVAGPWAATYLGEFGARVVHVEGPPFGPPYADATRSLRPLLPGGNPGEEVSESWVQYSRNKLSVGLDIRVPEGRAVFLDLARASDIWIESSPTGDLRQTPPFRRRDVGGESPPHNRPCLRPRTDRRTVEGGGPVV